MMKMFACATCSHCISFYIIAASWHQRTKLPGARKPAGESVRESRVAQPIIAFKHAEQFHQTQAFQLRLVLDPPPNHARVAVIFIFRLAIIVSDD